MRRRYIGVNNVGTLSGAVILSLENVRRVTLDHGARPVHEVVVTYEDEGQTSLEFLSLDAAEKTFLSIAKELGLVFDL